MMREMLLREQQDLGIEGSWRDRERSQTRVQAFQPVTVVRMKEVTNQESKVAEVYECGVRY